MKYYKIKLYDKEYKIRLIRSTYTYGGNLAVYAVLPDGSPYTIITVNLEGFDLDGDSEYAFVDTNNNPDIEQWLVENKIAIPTGVMHSQGFCIYPLYRFDLTKLEEIDNEK